MSGNVAPKIVRDSSLVLCLDAANTKSFQVGTIKWLDLSGDKLNATLYSGATYSSLNGGCITFDGVDAYGDIPNTISLLPSVGSGTIDFVYKLNATSSINGSDFLNIWGFTNNLFQYESNSGFMTFVWRYTDLTYNGLSSGIVYGDFNTYHITCTYTSTIGSSTSSTFKIYKNGLSIGNSTIPKPLISSNNSLLFGGTGSIRGNNCNIYNFKIYNRELSASEVLQNYNAVKSRFGLS